MGRLLAGYAVQFDRGIDAMGIFFRIEAVTILAQRARL
jgi:hypothetical protein